MQFRAENISQAITLTEEMRSLSHDRDRSFALLAEPQATGSTFHFRVSDENYFAHHGYVNPKGAEQSVPAALERLDN